MSISKWISHLLIYPELVNVRLNCIYLTLKLASPLSVFMISLYEYASLDNKNDVLNSFMKAICSDK